MRALEEYRSIVRFAKSKKYIDEALSAYNGAAYRSAIIAIWIAVVSDLIDKIIILADEGELAARSLRTTLAQAIKNGDKATMQRFEANLLEKANKDLHLIGNSEYIDLCRLREDRHLCAHPAYVTEDELFSPGPERVRAHLASAVDHLLRHGPIVGKKAVEKFTREVQGVSFPSEDDRLIEYLRASYTDWSTPALRANLSKVACKATLDADLDAHIRWRYIRTVRALYEVTPWELEEALTQILVQRQYGLTDDDLLRLAAGLCQVSCTWSLLHEGVRNRIIELLRNAPIDRIVTEAHNLFRSLPPEPLGGILLSRLGEASSGSSYWDLDNQIRQNPDVRLIPQLITLTKNARSYGEARGAIRTLIALAPTLTSTDLRLVLDAARSNDQVYRSVWANEELRKLQWETEQMDSEMVAEWVRYRDSFSDVTEA